MEDFVLVPGPQLLESMRAVGYSLKTAISDIIDNSLAASAQEVDIFCTAEGGSPHIAILDDGTGMALDDAIAAMKLAGNSTNDERSPGDLGRFGLGLKTASLSQCRRLTIVTKTEEALSCLRWDLDHIAETGQWSLQILDAEEASRVPRSERLVALKHGTLVVWEVLDSLENQGGHLAKAMDSRMVEVRDHISLVFHQFLEGYMGRPKVRIRVNLIELDPADPFLKDDNRTQRVKPETILVDGEAITVQLFTLPVLTKLSAAQRRKAQIAGSFRESQGFYVYRGGRLVIWGTWFRLANKGELGKLARVKVEIPNTLDSLWELDIKKSQAAPPDFVKERLRTLVARFQAPSQKAHVYRGRTTKADDGVVRFWDVIEDREAFRYQINRDHPLVGQMGSSLQEADRQLLEALLAGVEGTFPVQDAINRISTDQVPATEVEDQELWLATIADLWSVFRSSGESCQDFVERMKRVEPFNQLSLTGDEIIDYLVDPDRRPQ